jgi:hypothetical protein
MRFSDPRQRGWANLLTAYRRAASILKIEEKKKRATYGPMGSMSLLSAPGKRFTGITKRRRSGAQGGGSTRP